jgi:RNA polymerase sigma-70 factor (ECF subfamily)
VHPRTTTTILDGLADPANDEVWSEFDHRFRPVLFGFARRLGLGEADAADAAQEALVRFLRGYRAGAYDRATGRLSSWLVGIARHCILDRRRRRVDAPGGHSALGDVAGAEPLHDTWRDACEDRMLREALERLRAESRAEPRTIRAFELLLAGRRAAAVASELGMTLNDVYLAKHRCLEPLQRIVSELRSAYEVD